jgi:CRISPR type I-E-associated protein CasB/Cse2
MSVLRFRRLVEASEPEERLIALRRAVMIGKRELRVRDLARACLDWSDNVRREWIFQYYNAASAIPAATDEPSDPAASPSTEEPTP